MRILIDTNIFIYREDDHVIPKNLQFLLKTLNNLVVPILVHPLSVEEIERDKNLERKNVILSKIRTYLPLDNPPRLESDQHFLSVVGQTNNVHDLVDNSLLYCIYKDAVDFLITEDKNIYQKSERLGISDRTFDINEASEYFKKHLLVEKIPAPPALEYIPVHNLDINDDIFTSIKEDYHPKFMDWWKKISTEGRKAWVYFKEDNRLGAILIYKIEEGDIASIPPLSKKERVKICTFKVFYTGYKLGELFIKISIEFAIRNDIDELYLTCFPKPDDHLVGLIEDFGFCKTAYMGGEEVFLKKIVPDKTTKDPIETSRKFWPSFYDGKRIKKFVIPIRPEYHNKLFADYKHRQSTLLEFGGGLVIEGNTIKKAYLCHSKIREMLPGDILLFYRSVDERRITSLGVIEKVYHDLQNSDEIIRYVGKRSVYTKREIEEIAKKPTKVILFRQNFHFQNPLEFDYLRENNILQCAPRSITRISHENYLIIKRYGGINERFTVN